MDVADEGWDTRPAAGAAARPGFVFFEIPGESQALFRRAYAAAMAHVATAHRADGQELLKAYAIDGKFGTKKNGFRNAASLIIKKNGGSAEMTMAQLTAAFTEILEAEYAGFKKAKGSKVAASASAKASANGCKTMGKKGGARKSKKSRKTKKTRQSKKTRKSKKSRKTHRKGRKASRKTRKTHRKH